MKKTVIIALASLCLSSFADDVQEEELKIVQAIENATGWTVDELSSGLEMLNRVWEEDMKTPNGRIKWNGKPVSTTIDTNALTKTTVYTNGYRHVESFKSLSAMGITERLTAAEAKARREARARAARERKERQRLARIKKLETDLESETTALMAEKKWPYELARLYLINELNTLKSEAPVSGSVTPQ